MSVFLSALVLLGLAGVPLVLLQAGRHFRGFSDRALGAFRGSVVGYLASMLGVAGLLVTPPFVWPPSGTGTRLVLVLGLLVGPALGALIGGARAGR